MKWSVYPTLICLLSLTLFSAQAQVEGTLHYMNGLPQVVVNNPAFVPKYKFSLGLPFSSLYVGYTNNGFSYNDLVTRKNGATKVDLANWIKVIPDKTYIAPAVSMELFRLGLRLNSKLYMSASATVKSYNHFLLPKGLASIFIEGNAPFVNTTINLSPGLESITYLETALGASYAVTKKLTVGGRFKLLQGLESITTQSSDVSIAVSENYYLTASADLNVKTSGINNFNSPDFQISKEWKNYLKNKGVAIDVGATYRLTDKITFNASLIDIGGISWKNNLYQYSLDKTKAHYTFSGIDVSELLNGSASDYIKAQTDSIKNNFKLEEGATNSYRTPLPGKMFVGGTFEIVKNFNVGAVFFAEKFHDRLSPGWTTSLNKHFGTAISTSLSYTLSNRSYNNLGAGISLNMPPFQFYAVGDNLLRLPGSLIIHQTANNFINTSQVLNIRLGLNLVVGWDKSEGEALSPKSKTKPFNSKNSNTMGKRAQQTQVKSNSSGTSGKKSSKKTVNVRKKKKGRR